MGPTCLGQTGSLVDSLCPHTAVPTAKVGKGGEGMYLLVSVTDELRGACLLGSFLRSNRSYPTAFGLRLGVSTALPSFQHLHQEEVGDTGRAGNGS